MITRWSLTEKGIDTIPIEMMLTALAKWNAETVFEDKKPRKLHELFNEDAIGLIQKFILKEDVGIEADTTQIESLDIY